MAITLTCPACGNTGRVPAAARGKNIRCTKCGTRLVVKTSVAAPDDGRDDIIGSLRKSEPEPAIPPPGKGRTETEPGTWYVKDAQTDRTQGPYDFLQLLDFARKGIIKHDSMIQRDRGIWAQASTNSKLLDCFIESAPLLPLDEEISQSTPKDDGCFEEPLSDSDPHGYCPRCGTSLALRDGYIRVRRSSVHQKDSEKHHGPYGKSTRNRNRYSGRGRVRAVCEN